MPDLVKVTPIKSSLKEDGRLASELFLRLKSSERIYYRGGKWISLRDVIFCDVSQAWVMIDKYLFEKTSRSGGIYDFDFSLIWFDFQV